MLTAPRFVVTINGQQRCIAGVDGYAVLSAAIHFVRNDNPEHPRSVMIDGVASIRVGGLQSRQHVDWLEDDLFVGDEVSIRVLDGGPFDVPAIQSGGMHASCSEFRPRFESRRERLAKIGNVIPHRFQVLGNGESFCTAGVQSGVLSVMLSWVRRDPTACPPHLSDEHSEGGDVDLHVGGLENDAHIDWLRLYVDVGDEITVRVLGPGPFDPPQHREERLRIPHEEQTVVTASRITLRTPVPEDLDFLSRLLGSTEVMAHVQTPLNHEESKRWLERYQTRSPDDRGMLMIVDNESKALVGVTGTTDTEVGGEMLPVVQCLIDPSHWRQGYGTEAAWIAVGMATDPPSWGESEPKAAYAMIRPSNSAGLALARKFGMKCLRSVQYQGQEHHLFVAELR